MAAPSISTYILSNSSHYYGSEGGAAVMTSPSDSVTKVSAIISQTSGGAAIETVDTTVKTSSDLYADRWALTWPTAGITASPYYVRMWATNSDGDGAVREVAPYIYFPPSVSVTSPVDGSTLTDSSVTMAWTATDDYGISYQRVSVSHDGTELWGAEVGGNSIAVPSSVVFEDGESYSFSVMARNGKGMEATATNTASFHFDVPSSPELSISEGDGKSATIQVVDPRYSESGSTIAVDGSAIADEFTVFGKSTQDGTPTPSAPVPIVSVADGGTLNVKTKDSANVITTYPIDLQGNSPRSLPDGTRDELRVEGGRKVLVKRVGEVTFDGSETWMLYTASTYGEDFYTAKPQDCPSSVYGSRVTSNIAAGSNFNGSQQDKVNISSTGNVNFAVGRTLGITSVPDWKTWLASNNVTLLYPLAAPQEIDLGAASDHPFIPEDGEMWVDGTTMEASLRPADYAGQPMYDSVDVIRVNADGSTWTVASNLTTGDTVTDPLPPLGVDAVYKAVGKTSAGGMSEKLYMHEIPTTGWVLNFGDAAQETVGFIYNPQATMTLAQGGESYHFADGGMGGGFPVFYPITDRDASGTLAFDTVLYGDSDRLLDLCMRYPVAWLRDPFGHRWRAHVRPSVSHGVGQVWPVTIAWDAVRFEEV